MGQTTSPTGLEKQIDCLWTAANNTTAAGGGRLTDGLDKHASDRKELVTELALRCSSHASKRPGASNAGRSATPGVRPGDNVRAPAASSVPDTGTVYQQAPTTSAALADLLTNDEIRSLLADCDDFFAAMSDARLTWRARLLVALAFVDTVIILEQKAGRRTSGLRDFVRQGIVDVLTAPPNSSMERWKLHDVFYWALKYCNDPKMIGHATGGEVGDPTNVTVEGPYAQGGTGTRREPGTGTRTTVTIRECNKILELSRNGKHEEALRRAEYWHIVGYGDLGKRDDRGRISGNGTPKYLKPYVGMYPHVALPRIVARWCYGHSSVAEAVRRIRAADQGAYHLPEPPPRPPTTGEKVAKILLEEAAWTLLTWGAAAVLRLIRLGRIAHRLEQAAAVARAGQPAEVLFTAALEARRIRTLSRSDDLVAWFRAAMGGEKAGSYAAAFDLSKKAAAVVRLRPGDVIVQWGDPKKAGRWFALLDHNPKKLAIILEGREFRAFVVTRETEALAGVAATQKPGKIPGVGGPGGENQIVVPDSAAVRALSGVDAGR